MLSLTKRQAAILLGVVLLLLICWFAYGCLHLPQTVTFETAEQARTDQGVEEAAERAQVPVFNAQTREIAADIAEAPAREPDKAVATTGKDLAKTVETERKSIGADFSIVTPVSPVNTPKKTTATTEPTGNSRELPKIADNTPIVLNQYNIKAYPLHIMSATYYDNQNYDIAYQSRICKTAYIGPVLRQADGKQRLGVRVTVAY